MIMFFLFKIILICVPIFFLSFAIIMFLKIKKENDLIILKENVVKMLIAIIFFLGSLFILYTFRIAFLGEEYENYTTFNFSNDTDVNNLDGIK